MAYVQRVAAAYLKSANRTIGEFIPDPKPDRAEIAAKTDVAAAVKDYKGAAAMQAGEAFDASPKNIEARTERFTLPSETLLRLQANRISQGRRMAPRSLVLIHFRGPVRMYRESITSPVSSPKTKACSQT